MGVGVQHYECVHLSYLGHISLITKIYGLLRIENYCPAQWGMGNSDAISIS